VTTIDWWQIHNNLVTTGDNGSSLYGVANYGDYGVLSNATCGTIGSTQVCEPPADTPDRRPGPGVAASIPKLSGTTQAAMAGPDRWRVSNERLQ
jgi:hypothetical protein